jgi:hypothetical protein
VLTVAFTALRLARLTDPIRVLTRSELIDAFAPKNVPLVNVLIKDVLICVLRAFNVLTVSVLNIPVIVFSKMAVIPPTAIELAVRTPA